MNAPVTVGQRRDEFIAHLYRLHDNLTSRHQAKRAESRRVLACLRRAFAGSRHELAAYEIVFAHDPPQTEQEIWLLVAVLFALHPQPRRTTSGPRTIGAAMRLLQDQRGESAIRRFQQLVSADRNALPHYLRQAVRLLDSSGISLDYGQLFRDVLVLLGEPDDSAQNVRLTWARDFYRQPTRALKPSTPSTTA